MFHYFPPPPRLPPKWIGFWKEKLESMMLFNFFAIRILRVRRSLVLQDLLKEFLEDSIMTCELKIMMVDGQGRDERNEDFRGIYRDALASFWQEFYISCSLGERGRVPFLRHDFQSEQWTAVGRIIVKGFYRNFLPIFVSFYKFII